ncbi:MAG: extracellular solute-binding protein [Dehalococcoidales bacterium]|nr:extracellular solute-binding protein [Dehalococcoidales bacterium]
MKKTCVALMILILVLQCCTAFAFNETGMPITDEKTTFKIIAISNALNAPYNDIPLVQELEELTNVHIEWEQIATGYNERKNLVFSGGVSKLPDAFFGKTCVSDLDVIRYSSQGLLLPLEDMIDKYCPNIKAVLEKRPDMVSFLTAPDGHIYTLPLVEEQKYLEAGPHFFINKTWLDKVGLGVPTTTEEFYQALKAFKAAGDLNGNGKDDEIPFSFTFVDNPHASIMGMFGAFGIPDDLRSTARHFAIAEDGKTVVYVPSLDSYKEGVEWFSKLYSEGLIDLEAMTQDSSQYIAKGASEDAIYGAFMHWADFQVVGWDKARNDYVYMLPLKGPEGVQYWTYNDQMWERNAFVITAACKQPEVLMRWVDQMFDPIKSVEWIYGKDGACIEITADKISWLPSPDGMNQQEWRNKQTPSNGPAAVLSDMTAIMDRSAEPGVVRRTARTNEYRQYLYMNYYPKVYLTEEQSEIIDMYNADIQDYTDNTIASWIVKGGVEEGWDGYISQLYKMGLQDMIDVYQEAYDTYINNK